MTSTFSQADLAVEVNGLRKVYGSCVANDSVSFSVRRGTIHAIVGENGAGKSTTMKQLYGLIQPDSGLIRVFGQSVQITSPKTARSLGIGMVHQHFRLSQPHTGLDNVILSEAPSGFTFLNRKRILAELNQLSEQTGLKVDWLKPVEQLPIGVQQRIEILKVLRQQAQILILDEPTAVLTPTEVDELFSKLKTLVAAGKTVLIVTHKLREVLQFTDQVTVFRQGKVVGNAPTQELDFSRLGQWMVGREVQLLEQPPQNKATQLKPVLRVKNLTGPRLKEVSFDLYPGEIVGIAGVEGNGQSELIQALLFPKDRLFKTSGEIESFGKLVSVIPEDRHREGLLMDESLTENFLLGLHHHPDFCKKGILQTEAVQKQTQRLLEEWDVRPRDTQLSPRNLSGGNQQKFIIGREFYRKPDWMIAAQPTRGVDIGAIELIHQRLIQLRDQGCGIILVSSELDEIFGLSDRIFVFYSGRLVAKRKRSEANREWIGIAMGGGGQ